MWRETFLNNQYCVFKSFNDEEITYRHQLTSGIELTKSSNINSVNTLFIPKRLLAGEQDVPRYQGLNSSACKIHSVYFLDLYFVYPYTRVRSHTTCALDRHFFKYAKPQRASKRLGIMIEFCTDCMELESLCHSFPTFFKILVTFRETELIV